MRVMSCRRWTSLPLMCNLAQVAISERCISWHQRCEDIDVRCLIFLSSLIVFGDWIALFLVATLST